MEYILSVHKITEPEFPALTGNNIMTVEASQREVYKNIKLR